jgi:fructose/tagatose bisphosphate aldolase
MRYIIEKTDDGKEIFISEMKRISRTGIPLTKKYKLFESSYKVVYSSHMCCCPGDISSIVFPENITITKHYKSFEAFMEDNVELFL